MAAPTAIETPSGPAGGNERALIACDWTDVPGIDWHGLSY